MRLMLEVAYEYLHEVKQASLKEIFNEVKEELKLSWKETFPNVMMEKIEEQKLGELYTYLTTDGRFVMLDKNTWTIAAVLTATELVAAKAKVVIDSVMEDDLNALVEEEEEAPYNPHDEEGELIEPEEEISITKEVHLDN